MKKLVLLFILFFSTSILTAQFTSPTNFNYVCDPNNDGFASFYLGEISFEILGNLNAQDYTITHHETFTEAQAGGTPLQSPYYNINAFTQTIYARIVTNATGAVQVFPYELHVNPTPYIGLQNQTICDTDGDGTTFIDLGSISEGIWQNTQTNSSTLQLIYYMSQADANAATNPINVNGFVNVVPYNQTIYVRGTYPPTGCFTIAQINLYIVDCSAGCEAPTQLAISNVTPNSATVSWTADPQAAQWNVSLTADGGVPVNISTTLNPLPLTDLVCGATYTVSVATACANGLSQIAGPYTFVTLPCLPTAGQPTNLQLCGDGSGCFDLTANTPLIINNLNPSEYTLTYHLSLANAAAGSAAITSPTNFCTSGQTIFARLENNATHEYQVLMFALVVNTVSPDTVTLQGMDECDDNSDSVVIFNLTNIQSQINSSNALEYYTSLANAQNQVVPVPNPTTFSVGVQSPLTAIFVREIVPNGCDVIYTFAATAHSICNLASTCPNANSLCNALGVPFANTHESSSAEAGNYYGCLFTQPNPTWFYLPVSANGDINLMIEQNASIAFTGTPYDVDYIVYGPFANPVTPCSGQLTQTNVVSCSYSPNPVEYPSITNAQYGQYYLIMVTNYSDQAGFIRITEMNTTTGAIGCSGIRLNAFLDNNNNGIQDSGENNFPLGQFTYEANHNGNVHNITSPIGVYNIYDANSANTYDFSFAVDSNYSSQYSVSPASYSNINVTGIGMTVYNFPVRVVQSYNDLAVAIVGINSPRPGFTYDNKIFYTNNGNQTITLGSIVFNKDALVTINANTQTGTTPTTSGFIYNFTNLLPFETRSMTVTMQVPTLPTVAIGSLLTNSASVAPTTGDVIPSNNSASISQIILGSYDPNDKMESHGEKILYSSFTSDDYLYYTIRFENTGTTSAVDVRVNDVLDPKLDETSIKMVNASHPYVLDRLDNTLNWKFENIQLPPSITNTNTGKGYVMFKVKPRAGYSVGDIIPNTASIYFDFNPAIITNTFRTEFVQQLGVSEFENADFVFYPNPASDNVTVTLKNTGSIKDIVVYDALGKIIITQKPTNPVATQTVDLSTISKGIYLLEVTTDTNLKVVKKLTIK